MRVPGFRLQPRFAAPLPFFRKLARSRQVRRERMPWKALTSWPTQERLSMLSTVLRASEYRIWQQGVWKDLVRLNLIDHSEIGQEGSQWRHNHDSAERIGISPPLPLIRAIE